MAVTGERENATDCDTEHFNSLAINLDYALSLKMWQHRYRSLVISV